MTVVWHCPETDQRGELDFECEQEARNFSTLFRSTVTVTLIKG